MHPTQAVVIFRNISTAFGTLLFYIIKVKEAYLYSAYYEPLISRHSDMARVS